MRYVCYILFCVLFCHTAVVSAGNLMSRFEFQQNDDKEQPTYFIPIIDKRPTIKIDGKFNEAAWNKALLIDSFVNETGDIGPTELRLWADPEYVYLGFVCHERDMVAVRATADAGQRDQRIWGNHCIDIKMNTGAGPAQFIINSKGALSDLFKGDLKWNGQVEVATARSDTFWTAEVRIKAGSLWLPRDITGQYMNMTFGRTDPNESMHTLSVPYGSLDHAPRFVFGDAAALQGVLERQMVTRGVQLRFIMDREEYPRFCKQGIGRLRIWSGGGATLTGSLSMIVAVMKGGTEVARHEVKDLKSRLADFEMDLTQLPAGSYTVEARLVEGNKVFNRQVRRLVIHEQKVATTGSIDLTIPAGPVNLDAYGYTFGVPFPWGSLASADHVRLVDEQGREIPMQAEVTGRWARNGHIRWLLVDTVAPMRTEAQRLALEYGPKISRQTTKGAVAVNDTAENIHVDVGAMQFDIPRQNTPGIARLVCGSQVIRPHEEAGPYIIDQDGVLYRGSLDPDAQVVVEAAGPIKAQVSVSGWHISASGRKLGKYVLRYAAYRGLPYLYVDHTFIITEDDEDAQYHDIGYAIPTYAARGFFGAPRITPYTLQGADDSAYLIQIDEFHGKMYQNGKFMDDFGRAEGWINAGNLTISVRDFWQNFPKEFEARPDRAIVHFWPGHGEPARHTGEQLTSRNAYKHWFALEGKLLNFQMPQAYHALIERVEYADNAIHKVSPMGVSKTHQMLIQCNSWNWEQARARSVSRAFASNPTVVVDPKWVCDSKVFGDIGPKDTQKHPKLERAINGTMATIARSNDEDRDYGMWIFGDSHHFWNWSARRIKNYRTWRQTHHNWPRWPWLQYARSGDKATFDYACHNGRNVVDVAHCHYTTEEFSKARWPRGKELGGVCDYKGFAKWSSGDRFGYNSVADSMFHHYYFTGDRRALDTAMLHMASILQRDRTNMSREGSARICSLAAHVFYTWDLDSLELLERHIDNYVKLQQPNGILPPDATICFWTNGFIRYVDLTKADRGRLLITRWANLICDTDPATRAYAHQNVIDVAVCSMLSHLSQAYVYTGDENYLRMAKVRAARFYDETYRGEDPRFVGLTAFWGQNMPWSWFLVDMPYYAFALQTHGDDVEPAEIPSAPQVAALVSQQVEGKSWRTFHARLHQKRDEPFVIDFKVRAYDFVAELAPISGSGQVLRAEGQDSSDGKYERIRMEVPSDGSVEYAFRLRSAKSYAYVPVPIAQDAKVREVYPLMIAKQGNTIAGGEWFYFNIPTGADHLSLRPTARNISNLTIRDGTGKTVLNELWVGSNGAPRFTIPAEGSRQGWSIRYRGDKAMDRTMLNNDGGQPLYLSVSPEKWFEPSVHDWRWD